MISVTKDERKKDLKTKNIQERKKFTCNVCCNRFTNKQSCRMHMNKYHRVETGDKPAHIALNNMSTFMCMTKVVIIYCVFIILYQCSSFLLRPGREFTVKQNNLKF